MSSRYLVILEFSPEDDAFRAYTAGGLHEALCRAYPLLRYSELEIVHFEEIPANTRSPGRVGELGYTSDRLAALRAVAQTTPAEDTVTFDRITEPFDPAEHILNDDASALRCGGPFTSGVTRARTLHFVLAHPRPLSSYCLKCLENLSGDVGMIDGVPVVELARAVAKGK